MNEIFEIAYAAATNRLCLFTGTGFSKEVSGGAAPTWQGLLETLCDGLPHSMALKQALFPEEGRSPLSLEEAAQIISLKLAAEEKDIYQEVASVINKITLSGKHKNIEAFFQARPFRVVTTNYDKLAEALAAGNSVQSITPGLPIPRSSANVKVYHVHGSIDSPKNMVITSEDYFKFLNGDSYFSRKLSTVLHENTVVILGYSLGDTNLKAIINDYKGFSKSHVVGSNIFFISKNVVNQNVKDYYSHCYGIRVLDSLELGAFFEELNKAIPQAEKISGEVLRNIRNAIDNGHPLPDDYLKEENSFYEIIAAISADGLSWNNQTVVEAIGDIIESKTNFTLEWNAWDQYVHLARWIIYLGRIFELQGTTIKDKYLEAVLRSMTTMSKDNLSGYSWNAYKSWDEHWSSINVSNRILIKKYIIEETNWHDALSIVNSLD
ncbi:SIR2 family protein [Pantoea sp.]|uniref:SIR2 family NAD-dependent protein deacylase n=1 Tax=Pantoea sp. TaxID=69393 RepID=UPI0031DB22AC